MLVYSVTETVDIAIGYKSIVVLEICVPPKHWSCPPNLQYWLRAWSDFDVIHI